MERDLGGSFDMRGLSKFADCNQALRRTYVAVGQNLTLHGRLTVDRVLRALNPKSSKLVHSDSWVRSESSAVDELDALSHCRPSLIILGFIYCIYIYRERERASNIYTPEN